MLTLAFFTLFSRVSIIDFEQVNVNWVTFSERYQFIGKLESVIVNKVIWESLMFLIILEALLLRVEDNVL